VIKVPVRLALGSNLGDREGNLDQACKLIEELLLSEMSSSPIHETEPVGPPQGRYLNQILSGVCSMQPQEALQMCLGIEKQMGRERIEPWGPRIIDIDILTYGEEHVSENSLRIPHPRLAERSFVLAPWADLEADFVVPVHGRSVAELLNALPTSVNGSAGC